MSEGKEMDLNAEGDGSQHQGTISIDDKEINGIKVNKEINEKNDIKEKIVDNDDGDNLKENGDKSSSESPKDMRAVVINGFGGFKNIKALKRSEPMLSENEVLIKVKVW
jgi:hypothetical protein